LGSQYLNSTLDLFDGWPDDGLLTGRNMWPIYFKYMFVVLTCTSVIVGYLSIFGKGIYFEVFTVLLPKVHVFWDFTLCRLLSVTEVSKDRMVKQSKTFLRSAWRR